MPISFIYFIYLVLEPEYLHFVYIMQLVVFVS